MGRWSRMACWRPPANPEPIRASGEFPAVVWSQLAGAISSWGLQTWSVSPDATAGLVLILERTRQTSQKVEDIATAQAWFSSLFE